MRFIEGLPTFAVEVHSENDYVVAEFEMAAKRADYFGAGSIVVWDEDPIHELVRKYQRNPPDQSVAFVRGDNADADPAVPAWRMAVDWIFA